jgi:ATP-dependent Lon protease
MVKKRREIAILPLEDALLFPNTILPMHVYEKKYLELIDFAMKTTKKVAITFKKPGFEAEPPPGSICCLGTITYAEDAFLENEEGKAVVVSGVERVKIVENTQLTPFIKGVVEAVPDTCSSQTEFNRCKEALPQKLLQFLFLKNVPDKDIHLANLITDPGHIADFVGYYFIDDMYYKMSFLEMTDVAERCSKISELLDETIKAATTKEQD